MRREPANNNIFFTVAKSELLSEVVILKEVNLPPRVSSVNLIAGVSDELRNHIGRVVTIEPECFEALTSCTSTHSESFLIPNHEIC